MDGAGSAIVSWKAVDFLKAMNLRAKRTIRAILWTAEEVGLIGAINYGITHKNEEKHEFNLLIESDDGTFKPTGFDFSGNADATCI